MLLIWLVLSAACAAKLAVADDAMKAEWEEYKKMFNKTYQSKDEESSRFKKFYANKKFIDEHNKNFTNGGVSYSMGLNQFSDMDHEEYVQHTSCAKVGSNDGPIYKPAADVDVATLPKSVDWRKNGYVTPVRAQGYCGACYAFSAVGALEGQQFRKSGKLVPLSPQNIVDCSKKQGNLGCKGGWPFDSYNYVKQNKGIDTEKSYPYIDGDQPCKFRKDGVGATVTSIKMIKKGSESDLLIAVATEGPISVCIDATRDSFHHYKGGIIDDPGCSSSTSNHCVLVVGYGEESGKKYWIVKNSWGEGFGQKGYAYMSRDKNNQCAIATFAVLPVV